MKNKRIIIAICIVATIAAGFVFKFGKSRGQTNQTQQSQAQVPDQVVYKFLFHHVAALKKKAQEAEKDGKDATQFRTHFQRKASLTDQEANALNEVAAAYALEEESLLARAKPIVEAYKGQYPGGQVPTGQKPAPPPAELSAIAREHDALALRAREQLRVRLGDDSFSRFDKFVKTRVAAVAQQSANQ